MKAYSASIVCDLTFLKETTVEGKLSQLAVNSVIDITTMHKKGNELTFLVPGTYIIIRLHRRQYHSFSR